jgi:hypothetical protein
MSPHPGGVRLTTRPITGDTFNVRMAMAKYSIDELKKRLPSPGWRTITGNSSMQPEGTLADMAEGAHARKANGQASGYLQEIATEIEIDALQLQELWCHMGLPVV